MGSTEVFRQETQGDTGSEGAQRGQGNVGRRARTWSPQRDREVQGLQRSPKVYEAAWGCWGLGGATRGPKGGPGTPVSYLPWQCLAGGCPNPAPGLRAGRTQPSQAGAPCGNKQRCWGTREVMGGSFLGTCLRSHLVSPAERRAVRSPNIQVWQWPPFQFNSESCSCGQPAILPTSQGVQLPGAKGSPGAVGCVHVDNG